MDMYRHKIKMEGVLRMTTKMPRYASADGLETYFVELYGVRSNGEKAHINITRWYRDNPKQPFHHDMARKLYNPAGVDVVIRISSESNVERTKEGIDLYGTIAHMLWQVEDVSPLITFQITARMVKTLRESTGAGLMDCKQALKACRGDQKLAAEWIRLKGTSIFDNFLIRNSIGRV